jgi:hypothetical protein
MIVEVQQDKTKETRTRERGMEHRDTSRRKPDWASIALQTLARSNKSLTISVFHSKYDVHNCDGKGKVFKVPACPAPTP